MKLSLDDNNSNDIERLAMEDLIAVEQRDPACKSIAQVLLYFKGYKSIQAYRFAHLLWEKNRKDLAMVIQGHCSEVFGGKQIIIINTNCIIFKHIYINNVCS